MSFPSKEITIDFANVNDSDNAAKTTSAPTRKRRRITKLANLPQQTTQLVQNLHRTHLLALSARAVFLFQRILRCCSSSSLLVHVAYSLIPLQFLEKSNNGTHSDHEPNPRNSIPTYQQVHGFTHWYFTWVNGAQQRINQTIRRNRTMGAPSMQTFHDQTFTGTNSFESRLLHILHQLVLSQDEDLLYNTNSFISITPRDKVNLYIFLCYACLHWTHVRYVNAVLPMERELTCSHPLLSAPEYGNGGDGTKKISKKEKKKEVMDSTTSSSLTSMDSMQLIGKICTYMAENDSRKLSGSSKINGSGKCNNVAIKRETENSEASAAASTIAESGGGDQYVWVEVLCREHLLDDDASRALFSSCSSSSAAFAKGAPRSHLKWIHVDVQFELFNQPNMVENILSTIEQDQGSSVTSAADNKVLGKSPPLAAAAPHGKGTSCKKKTKLQTSSTSRHQRQQHYQQQLQQKQRSPIESLNKMKKVKQIVSYVFAVEHRGNQSEERHLPLPQQSAIMPGVRFTDVTPRYANTWSKTLRLRGATGREIASSGGKCSDTWWEGLLAEVNRTFQRTGTSKMSYGTKSQDAIKIKPSKSVVICIDVPEAEEKKEVERYKLGTSDVDEDFELKEQHELKASVSSEAIPTSKTAFKNHPVYAIPSALKKAEVLVPDSKTRICGMFKGELVYKRCDVSPAYPAKKWLYEGRKVRESELSRPAKLTKTKKNQTSKTFKALATYGVGWSNDGTEEARNKEIERSLVPDDEAGKERLYGKWQTDPWSPEHVGPNDDIPLNEYRNVEKALLNPGLVHLEDPRMSLVAKKLGIKYAPCLLGFEGHQGKRTPTIRGIVVHTHNAELLREAYAEYESHALEKEFEKRQQEIYLRWKRLIVGIQTKARLDREYGVSR